MKRLFDTNILVDYLNGIDEAKAEVDARGDRLISIVSWMELLAGARNDEEEDVVEMFLRDFRVIDVTRGVARDAVTIRRMARMKLPDAIVWASARSESAVLVTRNTKDFPSSSPGIRVPYTL